MKVASSGGDRARKFLHQTRLPESMNWELSFAIAFPRHDFRPTFLNPSGAGFGLFGLKEMQNITALSSRCQLFERFRQFRVTVQGVA